MFRKNFFFGPRPCIENWGVYGSTWQHINIHCTNSQHTQYITRRRWDHRLPQATIPLSTNCSTHYKRTLSHCLYVDTKWIHVEHPFWTYTEHTIMIRRWYMQFLKFEVQGKTVGVLCWDNLFWANLAIFCCTRGAPSELLSSLEAERSIQIIEQEYGMKKTPRDHV